MPSNVLYTSRMDEIRAKAYWKPAKNAKFVAPKPAGWAILDMDSGKRIGPDVRYATEEEATAAIPAALAARARMIERNEQAAAEREATIASADAEDRETPRRYRTVRNAAFGDGRVYDDQPGATQYDDGSGRYGIQIWDNS